MEHILNSETEGYDWIRYSHYVESIRDLLPSHVYAFASDSRYFDLNSHSSLHDAWLESLTVREVASGERRDIRKMEITITLLGPYHDQLIHLQYIGVTGYTFNAPTRHGENRFEHTAHGDLLTHEVRLSQSGLLIHELLFDHGTTFLIECSDIKHTEEKISDKT